MNRLASITLFFLLASAPLLPQESMEKVMEKRAREMHRVIGVNDAAQWKKFVKENYTQALIDKPMTKTVQSSDQDEPTTTEESGSTGNLEDKAMMFKMLHLDFGTSKILTLQATGEKLEMVIQNDIGLRGTFQLKFDKVKPYLISGIGIQANN